MGIINRINNKKTQKPKKMNKTPDELLLDAVYIYKEFLYDSRFL